MAIPISPQAAAQSDPGLFEKWRGWLSNPQNRTAMLQTGLALMQPVALGQSQLSHIAGGIGQGLAAAGRGAAREEAQARLDAKDARELESENLDREIKRAGLDLQRLNTESMISDREVGTGIARERLGLDRQAEARQGRYTEAQIANLESQSTTREGSLELRSQTETARQQALKDKLGLEQQKLQLQQEKLAASRAGDKKRSDLIDAQIRQIDTNISLSDKKVKESTDALAKINLQGMFKKKEKIASDVWSAANDPYAATPPDMQDLLKRRLELDQLIEQGVGGGGTPSPVPTSQYPQPKSPEEFAQLPSGTIFMAPDGSIRKKP